VLISQDQIHAAAARIRGRVLTTPVLDTGDILFKLEQLQHSGSFKARGMFNHILASDVPPAGIIAASGGNAGLAAAYAARELGLHAEIFVPETAPAVKVTKLAKLGAHVVQAGREYAEAYAAATDRAAQTGALFCHAYDDPEMVAGAGTIGLELWEQARFDTIMVSVGGGGLVAGIATALHGKANVIAVEPATCRTLNAALAAGHPTNVPVSGVAADSLGARRLGEIAFSTATTLKNITSVLVDDEAIVEARHALWDDYRLPVEHGTATALAALTSGVYNPAPTERVAVLLCGANTTLTDLA
jgi:threonine dehydratase